MKIHKLKTFIICALFAFSITVNGSTKALCLLDSICEKLIPGFESFRINNRLFVLKIVSLDTINSDIQFSFSCIYNEYEYLELKRVGYFNIKGDTIIVIDNDFEINFNKIDFESDTSFKNKLKKSTGNWWDGYVLTEGSTYVVKYINGNLYINFYGTDVTVPEQFWISKPPYNYHIDSIPINEILESN